MPGAAGDLGRGHPRSSATATPRHAAGHRGGGPAATGTATGSGPPAGPRPTRRRRRSPGCCRPGWSEDAPVRGRAVPLEVGAKHFHQVGRDGDGPGLVGGAVLQAAFLAGGAVVGPIRPGREADAARTIRPQPCAGKSQVALAEHDGLRWPQRGVVQAGVERSRCAPAVTEPPEAARSCASLGGADHDPAVHGRRDRGGGPLDAVHRIGGQVTAARRRSPGRCKTPTACAAATTRPPPSQSECWHARPAPALVVVASRAATGSEPCSAVAGASHPRRRYLAAGGRVERPSRTPLVAADAATALAAINTAASRRRNRRKAHRPLNPELAERAIVITFFERPLHPVQP